jgi:DNA-binding NarL/FixJ family response regulator
LAKILIVEDSRDFRSVVKDLLEKQCSGVDILEASTAEEGIGKAIGEHPDIILMDIHLPKMNGIDAAELIKNKIPECKIIILTMFAKEDAKRMYQTSGIEDFIGKNELYQKLVPTVRKYLQAEGSEK